jgi:hypothetical protein
MKLHFASPTNLLCYGSSQLERREAQEREQNRDNQKTKNYLRLFPADQLEMVMERRHFKDTFLPQLERRDLQDHRQRFHHEDAAQDRR